MLRLEDVMRASVGDRIIIKGHHVGEPDRDCEVLEVHGADGEPPWFVRWDDGQSEADALLAYAETRALQQAYGAAAAGELFSAYAETGDESLLSAYVYAVSGAVAAHADLTTP